MFAKGLIDCMRANKIKHVITFHEYIINCKFFSKILEHINNTEKLLNSVEFITGNDKKNIRKQIINDFQELFSLPNTGQREFFKFLNSFGLYLLIYFLFLNLLPNHIIRFFFYNFEIFFYVL